MRSGNGRVRRFALCSREDGTLVAVFDARTSREASARAKQLVPLHAGELKGGYRLRPYRGWVRVAWYREGYFLQEAVERFMRQLGPFEVCVYGTRCSQH
jgi:hypothetical protein